MRLRSLGVIATPPMLETLASLNRATSASLPVPNVTISTTGSMPTGPWPHFARSSQPPSQRAGIVVPAPAPPPARHAATAPACG